MPRKAVADSPLRLWFLVSVVLRFTRALKLPTFVVVGVALLKRMALVIGN